MKIALTLTKREIRALMAALENNCTDETLAELYYRLAALLTK